MNPTTFIVFGFIIVLFYFTSTYLATYFPRQNRKFTRAPIKWMELFWCLIAPIIGCFFVFTLDRYIHPFGMGSFPVLLALIAFYVVVYWISRLGKDRSSPEGFFLLFIGLILGFAFNCLLVLHFLSPKTLFGLIVFPAFSVPLLAPGIMAIYQWMELNSLLHTQNQRFTSKTNKSAASWIERELVKTPLLKNPSSYFLALFFLLVLSSSFWLFGFPMEALVSAFTGGKDFLFSLSI